MSRSKVIFYRCVVLVIGLLFWEFAAGGLVPGVQLVDPFFVRAQAVFSLI